MNVISAFNGMSKCDQEEYLKLRNKYNDDIIVQSFPELQSAVNLWKGFFEGSDPKVAKKNISILGIYYTNKFAEYGVDIKMSQFKHSCKPNAEGMGPGVRAMKKIKSGQEITVNHLGANTCNVLLNT